MALALAKLDVLDAPMKRKRLRPNVKVGKKIEGNESGGKRSKGDETEKKNAIKTALKNVEVAKHQLDKDLFVKLKKVYPHLEPGSLQAHSLQFLKFPDHINKDVWLLVVYLKNYFACIKQMKKEETDDRLYRDSLESCRAQMSQLLETLELTAKLIAGENKYNRGFPKLPDEMIIESSKARRQIRDYLFVRQYGEFLEATKAALMSSE